MQRKILEFANLLRQSGLRVSVSEAIDAFLALDELSIADRDVFRDALRASLVKRGDDIAAIHIFGSLLSAIALAGAIVVTGSFGIATLAAIAGTVDSSGLRATGIETSRCGNRRKPANWLARPCRRPLSSASSRIAV